jgi:hypothetical protein
LYGAEHIATRVELGIRYRGVDIDLRGEVVDDVRARAGDDVNEFRSLNVGLYQSESAEIVNIAAVGLF